MKYYAVKGSDENKIFTSWDECKEYIKGKNVKHKSFSTIKDANLFLTEEEASLFSIAEESIIDYNIPTAYIDGSYDINTGRYSFGGVLLIADKKYEFNKAYDKDKYSEFRNIAGEIKGAGFIIQYAINHNIDELNICYDYEGIEKWYKGIWKAKKSLIKEYIVFSNKVKDKIKINFFKIKSHSNDKYNDEADRLAKAALGIK